MLRLHAFQHVPFEGLGALESFFAGRGASITYTRFFAGESPPALGAFDMLVVLGGPMGVYDEDRHPWLCVEKPALKAALEAGKPVLGLCLGAQLMIEPARLDQRDGFRPRAPLAAQHALDQRGVGRRQHRMQRRQQIRHEA